MDAIRRVSWVFLSVWLALAAARSASAQYDLLPWRPYTGQYRTSSFPADQANGASFSLPPTPAPWYTGTSFADRIDADLDGDTPNSGRSRADQNVANDRTLRDKYYMEAQRTKDPAERARLMKFYREEDRRLSRELSLRPSAGAARTASPASGTRTASPRTTPRPPATGRRRATSPTTSSASPRPATTRANPSSRNEPAPTSRATPTPSSGTTPTPPPAPTVTPSPSASPATR